MSHVSTWMGDRLGIHGAVDIFPQMKQADLIIRLDIFSFQKFFHPTYSHSKSQSKYYKKDSSE